MPGTAEIRKAGAYNCSLIEAALDPLVTIGPDGKVNDVNAVTETATGRARDALIGTDFCDYFTEPEKARAGYQRVFREGLVRDYTLEIRHRDGSRMSVLYNATVYRDPAGQVAGVFAAAREMLLNAVKHSGIREAHLTMVRMRDDCCRIIVEDKGKGFNPASVRPGPSGGFGLFSIQQRLLYLSGKLEIESAPGQGTRAVLTMPISRAAMAETAPVAPTAEGVEERVSFKPRGRRISILLVDDHKITRQGLSSILQFENDLEIVAEAENGRQALKMARRHKPDVVIMDVNMPVMGGIEATRILRKEMPQTKVIGLSMHLDGEGANGMREAGAVAFLTKGGPSEDLVEAIRACCPPGKEGV